MNNFRINRQVVSNTVERKNTSSTFMHEQIKLRIERNFTQRCNKNEPNVRMASTQKMPEKQ